jgi:tRNA dimethylallyltransferase
MEPGNRRRIVRALEVIELTGRPFSSFDRHRRLRPARFDVTLLGLAVDPADLARRIEQRFAANAAGLVDEVRTARRAALSRTARRRSASRGAAHLGQETCRSPSARRGGSTHCRFARRQRGGSAVTPCSMDRCARR